MAQNKGSRSGNDRGLINVMVARFSAIGDVAMTIPVLYSACRQYPDVHFIFVTRPAMTGLFVNAPSNLELFGADVRTDYTGLMGMKRLVADVCRNRKVDMFIDLHDVIRTRMMGFWCRMRGIRVARLNKGRANRRALTRANHKVMLPLTSQRARYREAFFAAGLPLGEHFEGLYGKGGKADPSLFAAITPPKPDGEKWIAVAPFAAHAGKIYPPEMMEEVVDRIVAEHPEARIFLFGGGEHEQQVLEGWAAKHPGVVKSLAGKKFGFPAELALLSHMDVALTMDSANMHMASIAGAKTVSIWGATHPYCGFKGWRQSDSDTVQLPMTCRPCSVFGNKPCYRGDYLCLRAIKPETVYRKVIEKL